MNNAADMRYFGVTLRFRSNRVLVLDDDGYVLGAFYGVARARKFARELFYRARRSAT